ncbi:pilus assembly protein [Agarivorans sp. DSG3-1]|uniref:pilus assembly protein n=1 Tax=Agarivorans sp. DSG3-1 TaxID=3342249 RepID=UPI00398F07CC
MKFSVFIHQMRWRLLSKTDSDIKRRLLSFSFISCCVAPALSAANLNLADSPLYVATTPAPMVMLVMGRDHTLYYEAYNDATDLTGNDDLDINYNPLAVDYAGYFNSQRCYTYNTAQKRFSPGVGAKATTKTCSGSGEWSGDFLNYLTMSRMDVLRTVLYGGYRTVDSEGLTVLERVFIPQDAHSWGKSYTSEAVNGYRIDSYTPLSQPNSNRKHFFGSASWSDGGAPELRIKKNMNKEIWEWATTERPVLAGNVSESYEIRVEVCVKDKLEANCKEYPNKQFKPTGLLHDYGEDGSIEFGLLTGSYDKNLSGGVLRKAVSHFGDEIITNSGQFKTNTDGIVSTINKLRIYGFKYGSYEYGCGWITDRAIRNGECTSWGNPIGEMLYESLRYFHGEGSASGSYSSGKGTIDGYLGLPFATWDDPYENRDYCAAPFNLVISDISPSYDSDELPNAHPSFASSYSGSTLDGFHLKNLLDNISTHENIKGDYFIGESVGDNSGTTSAPTAKMVTSLSEIRGLSPQEPTKEGSYSVAAVAHYGHKTDMFPTKPGKQNIQTTVVAVSSPLPEVEVEVAGEKIIIVPFAKSVGGCVGGKCISTKKGDFQPTNTIVDYYVEEFSPTKGTFRINFEDVEQGADHEMDMIVKYHYEVKELCNSAYDNEATCTKRKGVQLTLDSLYAAGSIDQHAGYVISGTDKDGIYLDVKDKSGSKREYYLDTPLENEAAFPYNSREVSNNANDLPLIRKRNFFPSSDSAAATLLPSPLWYAAKWGGFTDTNNNGIPDDGEWDEEVPGSPDNYFPVTNAGQLGAQIGKALEKIASGSQSASPPVFNNNFLTSSSFLYQSAFDGEYWSGDVKAYKAASGGGFSSTETWSAAKELDAMLPENRTIFTRNPESNRIVDFVAPNNLGGDSDGLSLAQINSLLGGQNGSEATKVAYLEAVVNYLRGDRTYEQSDLAYAMRKRSTALGDVINSIPYYVDVATGHKVNKPVLVFGANDGMVHVIDAKTGKELMAYIPSQVYQHLNSLSRSTYTHKYFVDGAISAYTDDSDKTTVVGTLGTGVKGLYAIDVTNMNWPSKNNIKWEIDSNTRGFEGLGYSREQPTIAKLPNGKTGVIFSNGYNASEDEGMLFIADLKDGSLIASLKTGIGSEQDPTGKARPNGLASPAVVDLTGDGVADRIYAGDLFGNMWVFDVSSKSTSDWGLATTSSGGKQPPLFSAVSPSKKVVGTSYQYQAQPITTKPSVGVHPEGIGKGVLVAFGTGKYIEVDDNDADNQDTQSIYVIWDRLNGTAVESSRSRVDGQEVYDSNLLRQAIIEEDARNRLLTDYPIDWFSQSGWYLDFVNTQNKNTNNYGERQVSHSLLLSNKLSFTTMLPNTDTCASGGSGWYMELNLHSGRTWNTGTDGNTDPNDDSDTINNDSSHQKVEDGIPSSPGVIIDPNLPSDGSEHDGSVNQKNCITLSNGTMLCFDDFLSPTGRLSLRRLH